MNPITRRLNEPIQFKSTPRADQPPTYEEHRSTLLRGRHLWYSYQGRDPVEVRVHWYRGDDGESIYVFEPEHYFDGWLTDAKHLYRTRAEALAASIQYCRDYLTYYTAWEQRHLGQ